MQGIVRENSTPVPRAGVITAAADLRDRKLVGIGPVDAYGDVPCGRAEFLVESAVRADPQVVLRDFHLGKQTTRSSHNPSTDEC